MKSIKLSTEYDQGEVTKVVNDIIAELLAKRDLMVSVVDIRAMNDFTFGHSVNVAVLAIIVGIALGYDQIQLRKLAAGALFPA